MLWLASCFLQLLGVGDDENQELGGSFRWQRRQRGCAGGELPGSWQSLAPVQTSRWKVHGGRHPKIRYCNLWSVQYEWDLRLFSCQLSQSTSEMFTGFSKNHTHLGGCYAATEQQGRRSRSISSSTGLPSLQVSRDLVARLVRTVEIVLNCLLSRVPWTSLCCCNVFNVHILPSSALHRQTQQQSMQHSQQSAQHSQPSSQTKQQQSAARQPLRQPSPPPFLW